MADEKKENERVYFWTDGNGEIALAAARNMREYEYFSGDKEALTSEPFRTKREALLDLLRYLNDLADEAIDDDALDSVIALIETFQDLGELEVDEQELEEHEMKNIIF